MNRRLIICAFFALLLSPCGAQQKMRDVFLQMPDSLLPYLTEHNRLDFIDFIDSNMKAEVTNELDGKSEMLLLDDKSLVLRVSSSMQIAMQLMPVSEMVDSCQQVVCMITTYGIDTPESKVEIYSLKWRILDVMSHLALPSSPYVADFLPSSTGLVVKESNALDMIANEEQEKVASWLKNIEWKP